MSAPAPALAPDLVEGLRRLKLAAMRQLAPELLRTAKTQRWAPEELLRTLIEAEIAARDASNARTRLKTAVFPVVKTLDEFDRAVSTIPPATLDYLVSLEWITAKENLCLVGPAGTGKSHLLVALGVAAVNAGTGSATSPPPSWSRPSTAGWPTTASAASSTPCSATTCSSATRSGSPPWTTPARSCCSGSSPPPTNAVPWASPLTGPSKPGAGSYPNTPPPPASSTGSCTTPTS
jgi:IstB-like ATP binding protein